MLFLKAIVFLFQGINLIFPSYGVVFAAILLRPYYDIFALIPTDYFTPTNIAATDLSIHYCAAVVFVFLMLCRLIKKSIIFMSKYKIVEKSLLRPTKNNNN